MAARSKTFAIRRLMASFSGVSSRGAKKTPETFLATMLTAGLRCLFLDIRAFRERRAPEQDVPAAVLRVRHAAADRFENFGASQLGDQQAEDVPVRPASART